MHSESLNQVDIFLENYILKDEYDLSEMKLVAEQDGHKLFDLTDYQFKFKKKNPSDVIVMDIGSKDENGNPRSIFEDRGIVYVGVDIEDGKNVDLPLSDPYKIPVPDEYCHGMICLSTLEHVKRYDLLFTEMIRVLKTGKYLMLDIPLNKQPSFYPDFSFLSPRICMMLLYSNHNVRLEHFQIINSRMQDSIWIFKKV